MDYYSSSDLSVNILQLVGIFFLMIERIVYYLLAYLEKKDLLCHCKSCCGLCEQSASITDTEEEEEENSVDIRTKGRAEKTISVTIESKDAGGDAGEGGDADPARSG
jgi:hypothetical protein